MARARRAASEVLTFDFILNMMNETVQKVAKRRSLAWVNEVASRYNVSFAEGAC